MAYNTPFKWGVTCGELVIFLLGCPHLLPCAALSRVTPPHSSLPGNQVRRGAFHRHSPLPASAGPQSVSARQLHLGHPPPRCAPHLFVCFSVHFQLARS